MITSAVEEGQNRSRTSLYRELRRPAVDRYRLERNRLLGRMDRLRLLYITGDNIPPAGTLIHPLFVNILKHPTATRASDAPFRESEMEIGHWQPDADANQCPICYRQFSFLSAVLSTPASLFSGYSAQATAERKHHCRLCGKVICGRPSCSYYIQLSAASDDYETGTLICHRKKTNLIVQTGDQYDCTAKQLRACANCYRLIGGSEKKCFDAFTNELIELYKVSPFHPIVDIC
jgi:hypothetical protein